MPFLEAELALRLDSQARAPRHVSYAFMLTGLELRLGY